MSNADYKRGVEDALANLPFNIGTYTPGYIQAKMDERRERLLTKKVTKWVNVWASEGGYVTGQTRLCGSEEYARSTASALPREGYLGTYPIEIEVAL